MWHNLWRASNTGNRIEIIGEFADGKLQIDSNGRVNWEKPNKSGVHAGEGGGGGGGGKEVNL